jgi:hypothetical protein
MLVDSTGPSGDGTVPNPVTDSGTIPPTDGAGPPPPEKDSGTPPPPPAYGKICTANSECATNEICVKLASDSYPKTNPPPPKGMCLKKCSNPNAPCSSSASHFYPCIGASTWDLGAIQVCAIACSSSLGGSTKTYPCPTGTYCTRSFGGMMKICTPYQ